MPSKDRERLRARIAQLRKALEESEDPEIGFIALPSVRATFPQDIPVPYQEFLREADGIACGAVLLYECDDILKQQAPAKVLPGGRSRWFCFGAVEEKPLFLETRTNAVYCHDSDEDLDLDSSLGDLDYFLLSHVFGRDYGELLQESCGDAWLTLLEGIDSAV